MRVETPVPTRVEGLFPLLESDFAILALNGLLDVHRTERAVGFRVVDYRLQEFDSKERGHARPLSLALGAGVVQYQCALACDPPCVIRLSWLAS